MEYRFFGCTGLKVSTISFGTNEIVGYLEYESCLELVKLAYEKGINLFDTSEAFGNQHSAQAYLGKIFQELNYDRSTYLICTKLFFGGSDVLQIGLSRKHIHEGLLKSLQNLQTDYIDLVACHKPDENTSLFDIVSQFTIEIQQGRMFYWGTCGWPSELIKQATEIAHKHNLIAPSFEQPQYNILKASSLGGLSDLNKKNNIKIGISSWNCLGGGILTLKYSNIDNTTSKSDYRLFRIQNNVNLGILNWLNSPEGIQLVYKLNKVLKIAEQLQCSLAQLCIAYCLKNPMISTVIVGSSTTPQLLENINSLEVSQKVNQDIIAQINKIMNK